MTGGCALEYAGSQALLCRIIIQSFEAHNEYVKGVGSFFEVGGLNSGVDPFN